MQKIIDNVYYIGSYDKERKIFDELMPLSEGTTYNSYVVKGDKKTAIVETVYFKKADEYVKRLIDNNINVDYIIANHGEQDHTGAIGKVLEQFPNALVVTNKKVADNIISMLNIPSEKIKLIEDGEELSLGNKTLRFKFAPFVHWPDTMFTYLVEDNILFTCDFLGAHNTTCENIFADYSENLISCAKKYYAEIMMPFRKFAAQYTDYVIELAPKIVLPSHGPIYDNPKFILDLYKKWTSDETEKLVVISYVSMYGSTKLMVDYLKAKVEKEGFNVKEYDMVNVDTCAFASDLVEACSVIFASPMVLAAPHPFALTGALLVNALRPKIKSYGVIGSYGWGGVLAGTYDKLISTIKPTKLGEVVVKGLPQDVDYKKLDDIAKQIVESCNN
ncbi:MAG: FprA family A-type flavoprotein [Candidatus Gastranaerophilales bacterium]|nr:FprA family A-type flavoprotein [Candidatus Gastranaerophilales bacterium]